MLTDTEHRLMQSAIEQLRLVGLSALLIAEQHTNKNLEKIAESILKLHGRLETEYGKMVSGKTRKPRRKKEKADGECQN